MCTLGREMIEERYDERFDRKYFYDASTGRSAWTPEEFDDKEPSSDSCSACEEQHSFRRRLSAEARKNRVKGLAEEADAMRRRLADAEKDKRLKDMERRVEQLEADLNDKQLEAVRRRMALRITRFVKYVANVKTGRTSEKAATIVVTEVKRRRRSSSFLKGRKNSRASMYEGSPCCASEAFKLSTGIRRRWLKRFFALQGHYVQYFESANKQRNLKGTLDVNKITTCRIHSVEANIQSTAGLFPHSDRGEPVCLTLNIAEDIQGSEEAKTVVISELLLLFESSQTGRNFARAILLAGGGKVKLQNDLKGKGSAATGSARTRKGQEEQEAKGGSSTPA